MFYYMNNDIYKPIILYLGFWLELGHVCILIMQIMHNLCENSNIVNIQPTDLCNISNRSI